MCTVRIGGEEREFLSITILGRSHPLAADELDGNWIDCLVEVVAGPFGGRLGCCLRTDELKEFHDALVPLHESLNGEARFTSMEEWLSIQAVVHRHGAIDLSVQMQDRLTRNSLMTGLCLDQTFLPSLIH